MRCFCWSQVNEISTSIYFVASNNTVNSSYYCLQWKHEPNGDWRYSLQTYPFGQTTNGHFDKTLCPIRNETRRGCFYICACLWHLKPYFRNSLVFYDWKRLMVSLYNVLYIREMHHQHPHIWLLNLLNSKINKSNHKSDDLHTNELKSSELDRCLLTSIVCEHYFIGNGEFASLSPSLYFIHKIPLFYLFKSERAIINIWYTVPQHDINNWHHPTTYARTYI